MWGVQGCSALGLGGGRLAVLMLPGFCFPGPGCAPGGALTFFCFAKRKLAKKRRPEVRDPDRRWRPGQPAMLARRGPPWNSLRCVAAPFRQPRRVRARSLRVLRHAGAPAALCFSARPHGQGTTRAVAALGPGWGSAGALRRRAAPRRLGRAQQRPVSSPVPSGCAEEHRARGGRVCRRTRPLRDLTRRGCPSGARQRAASSTAPPHDRAPQVAPFAAGERGRRQQGRLSFGYFSLAKQRKAPRPPGRDPAPGSSASAAAQTKRKTVHLSKAQKKQGAKG